MMEVFEQLPGENAKHYAKRALLYNLVNLEMKPGDKLQNQIYVSFMV